MLQTIVLDPNKPQIYTFPANVTVTICDVEDAGHLYINKVQIEGTDQAQICGIISSQAYFKFAYTSTEETVSRND